MALVDIIIPSHNRAYTLKRCLDSIYNQSFKDFKLWLIDDGSTDETKSLVKDYPNLNYIYQKNSGVSSARNHGIRLSSAPYVAFCDSDDEWLEDKLEKQIHFFRDHPKHVLVHGEEIWVRKGKRVNPKFKHKKSGGYIFDRSLKLCLISPSAVMLKREVLNEFNHFREDFIVCEDYDLWLKICAKYEVGFIEDPLIIKYGGHEDQLSARYFAMDMYRVKSILSLIETNHLSAEQIELAKDEFKVKTCILKTGYTKHKRENELAELAALCERLKLY